MKRLLAALLMTNFALALAGAGSAEAPSGGDEPVRLKKKKKPMVEDKVEPEKPARKEEKKTLVPEKEKPGRAPDPADEDADEREVLERIARNLKTAEDRLANRELGEKTRQVQDDVIKDIDALIKRASQPPDSGQSQSDSGDSSQDQDQSQGQSGQQQKGKSRTPGSSSAGKSSSSRSAGRQSRSRGRQSGGRERKRGPGQLTRGKSGPPGSKPGSANSSSQGKNEDKEGNGQQPGAGTRGQEGKPNRAADVYKDIWGHLPESLRAEMNSYFNDKQFMAKYDDLIKRYYSAIAEKGRPKER